MKTWIAPTLIGFGALLGGDGLVLPVGSEARADDAAANILAVQIRKQGYNCSKAKSAKRDKDASKPGEKAWVLTCENATYRVRTIPNMADKVERLD